VFPFLKKIVKDFIKALCRYRLLLVHLAGKLYDIVEMFAHCPGFARSPSVASFAGEACRRRRDSCSNHAQILPL
jgi:hypothetical protein